MQEDEKITESPERVAARLKKTYEMLMEMPKESLANYIACLTVLGEKKELLYGV